MQLLALLSTLLLVGTLCKLSRGTLHHRNITNPRALCNDFSRAGFFLEENPASKKWIIFLESGGFCHSAEACNERFIHPNIRKPAQESDERDGYGRCARRVPGEFDPAKVWERNKHCSLSEVVSPLMTSVYRYRAIPEVFPQGRLMIEGRDLLDVNCDKNPVFCNHNHVIIPYCSSDLWLGNDNRRFRATGMCTCAGLVYRQS